MKRRTPLIKFFVLLLVLVLSACASDEETTPPIFPTKTKFTVSVNVTQIDGTGGALRVTLVNGDSKDITADGRYSFATLLDDSEGFDIDIEDPEDKECKFDDTDDVHTSGVIDDDDVEFSIACTDIPNYSLGGTTTGLNNTTITIHRTIIRDRAKKIEAISFVNTNGDFTLHSNLLKGDIYTVTISKQEGSEICELTNSSGTVDATNITNIKISCNPKTVPLYDIGGTASNIDANTSGVVLKVNSGNDKLLMDNDPFTFGTPVVSGTYTVTIQDPISPTQICSFANGTKSTEITVTDAPDNSLVLNCVTQTFSIGGKITSLASNGLLIANLSTGERANLTGSPPTSFAFATPLKDGYYDITISNFTSPKQTCTFDSNGNTIDRVRVTGADFSTANISCITDQYGVIVNLDVTNFSGTLGLELLASGVQESTLLLESTAPMLPTPFPKKLDDGTEFTVNILSQPDGLTCSFPGNLSSETKTITGMDATTSTISCLVTSTFTVNGTVVGLTGADSIGLQINNTTNDTATVSGSAPDYTFSNLSVGNTYNISIAPLPTDYDCSFPGDVTTVAVTSGGLPVPAITCRQKLIALTTLADANLAQCLTDEIAASPAKVYVDEIITLNCGSKGVTILTGIEQLFNLGALILSNNAITDVSSLAGLSGLAVLDLSNNLLADTTTASVAMSLEALSGLTDLNLGNDLAVANKNTVTSVPNIVGLTKLNLNNNTPMGLTTPVSMDLTNLANLTQLLELYLDGNGLTDLTAIVARTQLTILSISGNAFAADISALAGISALQTLFLKNNTVAMVNLASLAGLNKAELIDLSGNAATLCSEIEVLIQNPPNATVVINPTVATPGTNCMGVVKTGVTVSGVIATPASPATGLTATSLGLMLTLTETVPNNTGGQDVVASYDLTIDGTATAFAFPQTVLIPVGSNYTVTVTQQPNNTEPDPTIRIDAFCTVDAITGSGTISDPLANVTNVEVVCTDDPLVADVASFNTAQGVVGDIFNQCLLSAQNPLLRVSEVGSSNDLINPSNALLSSSTLVCRVGSNISDLSGIEYLKQVTILFVNGNLISDKGLEKISVSMPQLIVLEAVDNQITTLPTSMNLLKNIAALNLSDNMISDISLLKDLSFPTPKLAQGGTKIPTISLRLANNPIVDIRLIATFVNLKLLDLQGTSIGGPDVGFLGVLVDPTVAPVLSNIEGSSGLILLNNPYMECSAFSSILTAYAGSVDPTVVLNATNTRSPGNTEPTENITCTDYAGKY